MTPPCVTVEVGLLKMLYDGDRVSADVNNTCFQLGREIVSNPQPLLDTLVAAGVLTAHNDDMLRRPHNRTYSVVSPHVHEWHIDAQALQNSYVVVGCIDCGEFRNLPIEIPL